jgi:class 3 adenylate cyclase
LSKKERRLAAIMFTDMVGYTTLTQRNEDLALGLLKKHNDLIRPALSRFNGTEVKTIGDSFLIEFPSALEATECSVEVQRTFHEYNQNTKEKYASESAFMRVTWFTKGTMFLEMPRTLLRGSNLSRRGARYASRNRSTPR